MPQEGKITPESIIVIGFIVRQYRQYLDLVEGLLRDFFYVMEKDPSDKVSEEEKPCLHDQESLVMSMQALVVSYTPEEPSQYRVRPDAYIGSVGAPRYVDVGSMSEEIKQLFVKGREMAVQSLKDLQKTFDREGKETVLRRMEANHFAAHVDLDGDEMECVDCSNEQEN